MRVVILDEPPMFNVPVEPLVNPPVPDRAVAAVIVPLFVNAPVTVSKVADVKVPVFV